MPFEKGHKINEGSTKVGRKTIEEEIEDKKEKMKEQTIEELATSKVFGHLNTIEEKTDRQGVKEIALPVYIKSKAEKVEHSGQVGVTAFNFISNDTNNKTNNKAGGGMEEDMGQED